MLNSDAPIKSSSEDILGRSKFAEQLAQSIINYTQIDSFNIGLYGEWGSGKTSVINMVEESLSKLTETKEDKTIIMRFNPWMFTDTNQLIAQFFEQLSSIFKLQSANRLKKIGENVQLFGETIELTSIIPAVGSAGSVLSKFTKYLGGKISKNAENQTSNIQKIKDSLVKELKESNSKIVIFIDDIDRLSNKEIQAVFKLVKSIADFPNTIYVLAFDYSIVTRALGEVQNNNGEEYLEKIIQVPFNLPQVDESRLTSIFLNQLDELLEDVPESKFNRSAWFYLFNLGIRPFLSNLRDVGRLVNTLILKYSFLTNEVNMVDLLGLVTLQVFEPQVYSALPFYKKTLLGTRNSFSSIESQNDEIKAVCDSLLDSVEKRTEASTLNILAVLFPSVNDAYTKGFSFKANPKKNGNISDEYFFDRYFSLTLNEGLSLSRVEDLISYAPKSSLKNIIIAIDEDGESNLFLDYVFAYFTEMKDENDENDRYFLLVITILQMWYSLTDADTESFYEFYWNIRPKELVRRFLGIFSDEEKRMKYVVRLFKDDHIPIGVLAVVLVMFEEEHNRYVEEKRIFESTQLSFKDLMMIENLFLDRVLDLDSYKLIDDRYFATIKYLLENSKRKEIRDFLDDLISELKKSPVGIAKLVSSLVQRGKITGNFVQDTWSINYNYVSKYLEVDDTTNLMKKFVKEAEFSELPLIQQENVIAFILCKKDKDSLIIEPIKKDSIDQYVKENQLFLGQ